MKTAQCFGGTVAFVRVRGERYPARALYIIDEKGKTPIVQVYNNGAWWDSHLMGLRGTQVLYVARLTMGKNKNLVIKGENVTWE